MQWQVKLCLVAGVLALIVGAGLCGLFVQAHWVANAPLIEQLGHIAQGVLEITLGVVFFCLALAVGALSNKQTQLCQAVADNKAMIADQAKFFDSKHIATQAATEAIVAQSGQAEFRCLDVTQLEAVADFFQERPAFDILVNNAGTNRPKSVLELSPDDYDAVLDLNLKSSVFVAREAAARMISEKVAGSIIHLGSQMGHVGAPDRTLYCASKWGLEGFSKALALELAPHGIRSNTLCPTFIDTPLTKPFFENPQFREAVLGKIKLGRLGQVEDLMGPIVFLAGDTSAMMTGASLLLDGGWTAD